MTPRLAELVNCPREKIYERLGELEAAKAKLIERLQEPGPQPQADELLTPDEVAAMLKVEKKFIYNRKKALGGIPMGHRTLRFPRSKVEAYINRQERRCR